MLPLADEVAGAAGSRAPRVSVVVPNYQHARFLARRLESVLAQTFSDLELIYLDDGSTDDSAAVFARCAGDPRVRAAPPLPRSGNPFVQWNRGVALARGEYVWIAEADDDALPALLERLVGVLDANPRVGLAYCESIAIDASGAELFPLSRRTRALDPSHTRWQSDFVASGEDECRRYLIFKNTIPNASAVVFRRSVFEAVGGADEALSLSGDWLTWVKLCLASDLAFVAEPLNRFRRHRRSVRQRSDPALQTLEAYAVQSHIRRHLALTETESEAAFDYLARRWMKRALRVRRRISLRGSARIWAAARALDPRIGPRLLRAAPGVAR
jgi:glycosyltransferase involved in cell wall biosynthesis